MRVAIVRYFKVFLRTAACVVILTAAQFGSVHLLTARPSSWLFEASLDLGPPLLFAGDLAQFMFAYGSANGPQAPLRDQPLAVLVGLLVNICLYGIIAMVITWLFFAPTARMPKVKSTSADPAAK